MHFKAKVGLCLLPFLLKGAFLPKVATHVGDLFDKTLPADFIMTNVWGKLPESLPPISGVYYFVFEVFSCSEGDV